MSKHTPGPWKADASVWPESPRIRPADPANRNFAAVCSVNAGRDEYRENAALIAAAPETAAERDRLREVNAELLDALERIIAPVLDEDGLIDPDLASAIAGRTLASGHLVLKGSFIGYVEYARAAIAKAREET